LQICLDI